MKMRDDPRMKESYKNYKKFCKRTGQKPDSFKSFANQMEIAAARLVAHDLHALQEQKHEGMEDAIYVTPRLSDYSDDSDWPTVDGYSCARCKEPVRITTDGLERAKQCKYILCNDCVEELRGESIDKIIASQVKEFFGDGKS